MENYLKSIESECSTSDSDYFYISKLKGGLYIDNCVTSVNSFEQLVYFDNKAKTLMQMGLYDLRGWEHKCDNLNNSCRVLGLKWDKENDTLGQNVSNMARATF